MVVWNSEQIQASTIAVSFHSVLRDLAAPVRLKSFLLSGITLQKAAPTTLDFYHSSSLAKRSPWHPNSHFRFRVGRSDGHAYHILLTWYHRVDDTSFEWNSFEYFPD